MRPKLALLAALALAALASPAAAAPPGPLRMAVLDFTNAAPDPAWDALGKGLQSMMTTDLADLASTRDDIQIVERARLVDIQGELKLGASGAVDKATAAKIGKLAGATHLVAGSFTVVGSKMRLDARLIAVQGGDVTLPASAEGDKDAFFELEKDLVKKLVDAVGVKLQPKERAKLNQVHTADLEAFRAYSEGIAQFDAKKYQAALDNLEKAARIDQSFELAKRTLSEYEKLAADARGHADAAVAAEAERARLLAAKAAAWDGVMLERITKVQDTAKDPLDRAIATSLLVEIFDPDHNMNGRFADMRAQTDPFVLERLADRFAQKYVADAKPLAPKIALFPYQTVWGVHGLPDDPAKEWDAWWKGLRTVAQKEKVDAIHIPYQAAMLSKKLHYDLVAQIDLAERAMRAFDAQQPVDRKVKVRMDLAEDMLKLGLTDRAAKLLTEVRQFTQDAKELTKVADWLQWGRDLHAEMDKQDALAPWRRELFALNPSWPPTHVIKESQKLFVGAALSDEALKKLTHHRRWSATYPGEDYRWCGDTLVWPLHIGRGEVQSGTGATNRLRAPSFRWFYNGNGIKQEGLFLAAFGETSGTTVEGAFTIDFKRAKDWTSSGADKVDAGTRPRVTFLFAMRDVLTPGSPLDAWGVRLDGDRAALVNVRMPRTGKKVPEVEVVKEGKLSLGAGKTSVEVTVTAGAVSVKAGGGSQRFELGSQPHGYDGFAGMLVEGPGYVEVGDLRVGRP
ncbi:MAG: hypothetical protein IT385_02135 [Deltaproteobacteria bacterium]|nr:hypothetical protein [Deltaproteobacteria bacterium]